MMRPEQFAELVSKQRQILADLEKIPPDKRRYGNPIFDDIYKRWKAVVEEFLENDEL